jgi:hypothetical protein
MGLTDDEKIAEMARRTARITEDRDWIIRTIPEVFPEKHGGDPIRGRLNAVARPSR